MSLLLLFFPGEFTAPVGLFLVAETETALNLTAGSVGSLGLVAEGSTSLTFSPASASNLTLIAEGENALILTPETEE